MNEILGQAHALDVLRRALGAERVHHAWIFQGPRGVGKRTTATAFARILLDPAAGVDLHGQVSSPPDSETARLVAAGTHPDLHLLHKELALVSDNALLRTRKLANIPVDLLREHMIGGKTGDDKVRKAPAYRTATLGHGKVFIVDEAELIDTVGQNSLLKTLEEPPPETYIILVTSRPERLLPTIRSRSHPVCFTPLDDSAMRTWMDRSLGDVAPDERAWLDTFAEGRPGLAVLAHEYGFRAWQTTIDPMLADVERGRFPAGLGGALGNLVDGFAEAWVKGHKNASVDAAKKDGARHVFHLLAAHARRRLTRCAHGEGARETARPWIDAVEHIRAAEMELESNVNLKQLLENLVVQWSSGTAANLTLI